MNPTKTKETIGDKLLEKLSITYLREQVLKNAYGNDDSIVAHIDPRILLIWYCFFGIVPWFLKDPIVLGALLFFVVITATLAKMAPLVLFLFGIGVLSQTGYLFIVTWFFGRDMEALLPLLILTLKVATVSLASITVFSGLEPDKLSLGLMYFGFPEQLSFSISFSYRILPILMEEFQHILFSHRVRGVAPKKKGIIGRIKRVVYHIRMVMMSFYPLMLNMAKRSRTTVEALELKGYNFAEGNNTVKKLKLKTLKLSQSDLVFVIVTLGYLLTLILTYRKLM